MSYRQRLLGGTLILLAFVANFTAGKEPEKGMDSGKAALHYLSPTSIDALRLLPAPPGADSQEQAAELDLVLKVQETRTRCDVERARSEKTLKMSAYAPVVGSWFTAENLPLTAKLIKAAEADSKFFSGAAKEHFARPRPPHDARVHPAIIGEDEPSYPSGHSTRGMLFARIIAELDPDHRDALLERGREIGWDRVIAGVHYPSDIFAGRVLGQAVFEGMRSNPDFQKDLESAKAEFLEVKNKNAETKSGS